MPLTMVQSTFARTSREDREVSFSTLARQHYEAVYNFLLRRLPSPEDAADITQEIFLKAQESFHRFDPSLDFAPWIFTIARRSIADFYRRRGVQKEAIPEDLTDPSLNPRESALKEESADGIWAAASRLKPRLNEVLLLHYREHFSITEIAGIMKITETHTKVLLFRARAALKKEIESQNQRS